MFIDHPLECPDGSDNEEASLHAPPPPKKAVGKGPLKVPEPKEGAEE